jgi:hypothetical protein
MARNPMASKPFLCLVLETYIVTPGRSVKLASPRTVSAMGNLGVVYSRTLRDTNGMGAR